MTRRGWLLFAAMCVIWGIPYLFIKVAVDELDPWVLGLSRTALGAALLLPIAAVRGQLRPLVVAWRPLLLYTVIEISVPWLLLGFAETRLSSSLTGLLVAAVPLMGALFARERLDARRSIGLALGVLGVAALLGLDVGHFDAPAVCAVLVVVVGYASGPLILSRRLAHLPTIGVVATSLGLAALIYAPVGIFRLPSSWPSGKVVAAVLVLAVVCTALAFLIFFRLIAEVGPVRATVITYVNPAVAVLLGVVVLDERFTVATVAGFALILTGCVLATRRSRQTGAAVSAPAAAGVSPER